MTAKVLIVDDSSLARRTMRRMLESMGHTVEEANDGASALERCYVSPPDLVMLDIVMNGMHGFDVLAKLRQLKPDMSVIVATADIQDSTRLHAREAGAAACINKPINRTELAAIVERVLKGGVTWT